MYKSTSNPAALQTQRRVCETVLELCEHHSLREIKVKDICERAGISRSAFYRNFESAEDVLLLYLDFLCVELAKETPNPTEKAGVETCLTVLFRFWRQRADTVELFFRNGLSGVMIQRVAEVLPELMTDPPLTKENPIKGFVFWVSGVLGVVRVWAQNRYEIRPEEMARWITENIKLSLQREDNFLTE